MISQQMNMLGFFSGSVESQVDAVLNHKQLLHQLLHVLGYLPAQHDKPCIQNFSPLY
jgi:hypothetical protein